MALAAVGIVVMTDESVKRVMSAQSILFLVAQSFTLTRASRDWSCLTPGDMARPTLAYIVQVLLFFLSAFALSVYSVAASASAVEWRGFMAISLAWATVSALCLSKTVRDRSDAQRCLSLPRDQHQDRLLDVLRICTGTLEYQILVWASAVLAVVAMLGIMWSWDAETLALERKGFISVCLLWCEVSSFHLAKLVRDRADPKKAPELLKQRPFQILVVLSSAASSIILLAGILLMPLQASKRFFLLAGFGYALSSAFFLAKHVRDKLESKSLAAEMNEATVVQASVVAA